MVLLSLTWRAVISVEGSLLICIISVLLCCQSILAYAVDSSILWHQIVTERYSCINKCWCVDLTPSNACFFLQTIDLLLDLYRNVALNYMCGLVDICLRLYGDNISHGNEAELAISRYIHLMGSVVVVVSLYRHRMSKHLVGWLRYLHTNHLVKRTLSNSLLIQISSNVSLSEATSKKENRHVMSLWSIKPIWQ